MREPFQFTRPAWGATNRSIEPRYKLRFNSRAPRGARLCAAVKAAKVKVSIHAPRVGRDITTRAFATALREFQFTRPAWGATSLIAPIVPAHTVSIHAPRVGRDG